MVILPKQVAKLDKNSIWLWTMDKGGNLNLNLEIGIATLILFTPKFQAF